MRKYFDGCKLNFWITTLTWVLFINRDKNSLLKFRRKHAFAICENARYEKILIQKKLVEYLVHTINMDSRTTFL